MNMSHDHGYGYTKAAIRRSFDRAASQYDRYAILQSTVGERLLERLDLVNINPQSIIDLGSGTGIFTRQLQQRYKRAKVVGIDLAPKMIAYANQQRKWLAKERYICADAESLPLQDSSVNLVFSNLMMQWVENPDRLFQEIKRILVPGGLVMFTSYGPDSLKELRQSWQLVDDNIHVNRFMDMHDVGDSMTKNGFEGAVMDNETITMTYEELTELHQDLRALGEVNLNQGRRRGLTGKNLWRNYLKTYQQFVNPEGLYPASWEIVYGHAWAREGNGSMPSKNRGYPGDIDVMSL